MLERPLTLPCGLTLSNRTAKAAMTEALATPDDLPSAELLRLYAKWAQSGAGLLVTGNVGIDRRFPVRPGDVMAVEGAPLKAFQEWARAAKAEGARVIVQINHAGRQVPRFVAPEPLAPSAVAVRRSFKIFGRPRAMTRGDIDEVVSRFVVAARMMEAAGFDGVQVHAAHGYLLSQFLSPLSNVRDDEYGGSVENRARLLLRVVRSVREAVAPSFAVAVKLNSADFQRGGFAEGDALEVVRMLDREGIDLLELSGGNYETAASFGYSGARTSGGYFVEFARKARTVTRVPLMLTGGFHSLASVQAALGDGCTDLVGLARPMALDPALPTRLLRGIEPDPIPTWSGFGSSALNSAAELGWYSQQLERVGRGEGPDPEASRLRGLLSYLAGDFARELRRRAVLRARTRTARLPSACSSP